MRRALHWADRLYSASPRRISGPSDCDRADLLSMFGLQGHPYVTRAAYRE